MTYLHLLRIFEQTVHKIPQKWTLWSGYHFQDCALKKDVDLIILRGTTKFKKYYSTTK